MKNQIRVPLFALSLVNFGLGLGGPELFTPQQVEACKTCSFGNQNSSCGSYRGTFSQCVSPQGQGCSLNGFCTS